MCSPLGRSKPVQLPRVLTMQTEEERGGEMPPSSQLYVPLPVNTLSTMHHYRKQPM